MNVQHVQDQVVMAMGYNGAAKANLENVIAMLPEGDYKRSVMFYALKVLKDCKDDYERVLRALEGCK